MKRLTILLILSFGFVAANSQKYMTKNGYIGFHSYTTVEDIKADNNQVAGVFDTSTAEMVFQVLIKSFHFDKALMEEHFNENYMESDKFPKATFTGKIINTNDVIFSKPGTYDVQVEGDLTIHGVTNKMNVKGTIEVSTGGINATSKFNLVPEDYKINIPGVVRNSIAKTFEVTVIMKYAPLEKN
jgi:polyisoprenoid-binding protein YceI